jgi:hypothetical protein
MAENPMKRQRRYVSYLLRLWREGGESPRGGAPVWRASLEGPQHGERLGFRTLPDLFAFLEKEIRSRPGDLECSLEEASQLSDLPD